MLVRWYHVWQAMVLNLFMTNAITNSVSLLMRPSDVCSFECAWPAYAILTTTLLQSGTAFVALVHFHIRHRQTSWQPLEPPDAAEDIEDPLYRAISKLRVRLCSNRCKDVIMDRPTGSFVRQPGNVAEPGRTERLLSRPFTIFHSTPTDALDALKMAWLDSSSGHSWCGVFYDWSIYMTQFTVAAVQGVGTQLQAGSSAASAQVLCVLGTQYAFAAWVLIMRPSSDRINNWEIGVQYTLEGTATLLTMLSLTDMAFGVTLAALFVPITVMLHDAVVVQISTLCRRSRGEEFSWVSAAFAMAALLLSIPGAVLNILGMSSAGSGAGLLQASSVATEVLSGAETAVEDMGVGVADGLAELARAYFWATKPLPTYHRAATRMQSIYRGRTARASLHATEAVHDHEPRSGSAWLAGEHDHEPRSGSAWLAGELARVHATEQEHGELRAPPGLVRSLSDGNLTAPRKAPTGREPLDGLAENAATKAAMLSRRRATMSSMLPQSWPTLNTDGPAAPGASTRPTNIRITPKPTSAKPRNTKMSDRQCPVWYVV
jgi:hypothetical protein